MKQKLAIIGASITQLPLCLTAQRLGYETLCFAWSKGAVCKDVVDSFYNISVTERERILSICREQDVCGVVSNCSDFLADIVVWLSEQLGLHTIPYEHFCRLKDKGYVRSIAQHVPGLTHVETFLYEGEQEVVFPCVIKPTIGGSKRGVSFVKNKEDLDEAIRYAGKEKLLVEQYIEGKEISVETLSYEGQHYVIQITDKDCFGAPHFIEVGHHQPAYLSPTLKLKICNVIPDLLSAMGYINGAAHIELKYDIQEQLYLIEVNLRGGGDGISNKLIGLSTDYDYLKGMIDISSGKFRMPIVHHKAYSGIYYLTAQTKSLLPIIQKEIKETWCVERTLFTDNLRDSFTNDDRCGYLIYQDNHKIKL